jgi:hypothetical protein
MRSADLLAVSQQVFYFMQISESELKSLESIWLEQNPGRTISKQELLKLATGLLVITKLVYFDHTGLKH